MQVRLSDSVRNWLVLKMSFACISWVEGGLWSVLRRWKVAGRGWVTYALLLSYQPTRPHQVACLGPSAITLRENS